MERRENTVIISPSRPSTQRRSKRRGSSPATLLPVSAKKKSRSRGAVGATKRRSSKYELSTPTRQPLTPLRPNLVSPTVLLFTPPPKKSKAATNKPLCRASLKPQSPLVAVDILVIDENGGTVSQERRLSHPDIQTNLVHPGEGSSRRFFKDVQPIIISDDSDVEELPLKARTKRSGRRSPIVIPSEPESDCVAPQNKPSIPTRSLRGPSSLRVEVVIPPPPWKASKRTTELPSFPSINPPAQVPIAKTIFQAVPSLIPPPVKTRQLTPIRGSSSRTASQRQLPTPSTPTDLDLSLELAHLDITDATETDGLSFTQPEYLVPLLKECSQTCPHEFSAFIETFPFDPVVQSVRADDDRNFRKIGEASFSEVFGIGDVVLKIIPIRNEENIMRLDVAEFPAPSDARDVLKEIIVTREMGGICNGFVRLLKTYVVRGRYPSLLLDLWDDYNEKKGSESTRPDSFGLAQIYVIIVLPNGGPDLESFMFPHAAKAGWLQACSIFWQVAKALGQAEGLVNFEHRDLHWGQILVTNVAAKKLKTKPNLAMKSPMDDTRSGVKVTIIDLGLSRMEAKGGLGSQIYWTPLEEDIFEGEGDYQYDVYRMMRDLTRGSWDRYQPFTNVMWLHYLAKKLLHSKRLKPPSTKRKAVSEVAPIASIVYDEQECYECLVEMEKLLAHCTGSRMSQKGRRKAVSLAVGIKSAAEVVNYAVQRGWLR